jgi:hypothetical protein
MKLNDEQIRKIEAVISRGERVEIIPVKDGIRIMRVRRETV